MTENNLTVPNQEVVPTDPVGLQYFKSVDRFIGDILPDDRGYQMISVCDPTHSQPEVRILRKTTPYLDGNFAKQDEISLLTLPKKLQFNATCTLDLKYVEYPEQISPQSQEYLAKLVQRFGNLEKKIGSKIYINGKLRWTTTSEG